MKTVKLLLFFCCASFSIGAKALSKVELLESRPEITVTNIEPSKAAIREAKKLAKEGWQVSPGALPIEIQIEKSWQMQQSDDEFIMGEAQSIGMNYDAAKMQALELARLNLASRLQTEITATVDNLVGNQQLTPEEAASVVKSISKSQSYISQYLGRVQTVVELYRTLSNGNKEVLVRIAYNAETARKVALDAVCADLEQRGDKMVLNKLGKIRQ